METSIILNIIFISLVGLGFICYQIWLGSKLVKTNKKLKQTISQISDEVRYLEEMNKGLEAIFKEDCELLQKNLDRLDSRLDERVNGLYNYIDSEKLESSK